MLDKYNTIIWDWNGTLLNDVSLCIKIVNELLPKHNSKQLNEVAYKEVFGFPITEYYKRIGIDFKIESFEILTKKFIANYDSQIKKQQLHPNAIDVLKHNKQNNKQQYILTAGHKESVTALAKYYGVNDYFVAIEGLDNHKAESKIARGKDLLKNNTIIKKETVLIGDTIHDYEVAQALEVDCILIANGHQSFKRLATVNTSVINTITDLVS